MKYETKSLKLLYSQILSKLEIDDDIKKTLHQKLDTYGQTLTKEELEELRSSMIHDLEILRYVTGQIINLNKNKEIVTLSKYEIDLYASLALKYVENAQLFERSLK